MSDTDGGAAVPQMTIEELLALPVSFGLRTAARALGIGQSTAYEMAAAGTFPCPVLRVGNRYLVTRPNLFQALGLDPAAVAARGEDQESLVMVAQCHCQSGDVARAFYNAVLAAARVLVEEARSKEAVHKPGRAAGRP
jgi:hypothetical protein